MATTRAGKLKSLLAATAPGRPLTPVDLGLHGVSADLAVHYVRTGWLKRVARGVYSRPGDRLDRNGSLVVLERSVPGLHVGSTTALDWQGFRHYVAAHEVLSLYGWEDARIPRWFTERFPNRYHRKRLFDETPEALVGVKRLGEDPNAPLVSVTERALLELLSDVGVRGSLQEARELMESMGSLRTQTLQSLLERCTSVKTVRLCLQLGNELNLPWARKLDRERLHLGSKRPWVGRTDDGLLVLP